MNQGRDLRSSPRSGQRDGKTLRCPSHHWEYEMTTLHISSTASACALALIASLSAEAAPPMYRTTVIPSLPGDPYCQVAGLNDAGQVIGDCNYVSFIWTAATGIQAISDPAFPQSQFSS